MKKRNQTNVFRDIRVFRLGTLSVLPFAELNSFDSHENVDSWAGPTEKDSGTSVFTAMCNNGKYAGFGAPVPSRGVRNSPLELISGVFGRVRQILMSEVNRAISLLGVYSKRRREWQGQCCLSQHELSLGSGAWICHDITCRLH